MLMEVLPENNVHLSAAIQERYLPHFKEGEVELFFPVEPLAAATVETVESPRAENVDSISLERASPIPAHKYLSGAWAMISLSIKAWVGGCEGKNNPCISPFSL